MALERHLAVASRGILCRDITSLCDADVKRWLPGEYAYRCSMLPLAGNCEGKWIVIKAPSASCQVNRRLVQGLWLCHFIVISRSINNIHIFSYE